MQKEIKFPIKTISNLNSINFDIIEEDEYWNNDDSKELLMHRIHIYPAKFPAFIAQKAFTYAKEKRMQLNTVCDIFCGCGTVALESRRHHINFIGFDINPVAVMISEAKGNNYDIDMVKSYQQKIIELYNNSNIENDYATANERLKYWFHEEQYFELLKIKSAIETIVQEEKYKNLFYCIFSNSLKRTSRWLAKSIKPQIDPDKICSKPIEEYELNFKRLIKALNQLDNYTTDVQIVQKNILENDDFKNQVDMIITSPPYVTSYEYADLHQLSTLWLYTDDFKKLRVDSIGSLHNLVDYAIDMAKLNETAASIVNELKEKHKSKAKSVARYYSEMSSTVQKCKNLLKTGGRILFVIGDTDYKGIKMQNAKFICEALIQNNFEIELISRRKISNKYLTPYRDENGKFSNNKEGRKIYSQEFIIIGRKK